MRRVIIYLILSPFDAEVSDAVQRTLLLDKKVAQLPAFKYVDGMSSMSSVVVCLITCTVVCWDVFFSSVVLCAMLMASRHLMLCHVIPYDDIPSL